MSSGGSPVDVVVIGGGPGGYTAAFRAADLGLSVALVERHSKIGGVCLHVGCIPSKALLHVARLLTDAAEAKDIGVHFDEPYVDVERLREATTEVVDQLANGLAGLAKRRGVRIVHGSASFASSNELAIDTPDGIEALPFSNAIIAVGSEPVELPGLPADDRIVYSEGALALAQVPERLLVIGGGIIGLEMATVYEALGSTVTVVEALDDLIPGCDQDLVTPLRRRVEKRYGAIHLSTRVAAIEPTEDGLSVTYDGEDPPPPEIVDGVLVAVGRRASGDLVGADAAGVEVGERGVISVDDQMRTNVPHIFAIGDVVGDPMLAHKSSRQGIVAAEVIAGHPSSFDGRIVPSVAYTDPEIAWAGLTETEAAAGGIEYESSAVPWAASGRAVLQGRGEGRTKLLLEPGSRRVIGAGIVGVHAGDLISEAVHAIEMGSDAEDLALTIHPHPTLSETVGMTAEAAEGTVTDLYLGRRARPQT